MDQVAVYRLSCSSWIGYFHLNDNFTEQVSQIFFILNKSTMKKTF